MPWTKSWKPVSVLTGFLGSGKTTILQHLLSDKKMSGTALIINEFGPVSIDHLLVETPEEKMVLLSNGCVCCSVRGDLVSAVISLFKRQKSGEIPPFDRILLETTGLADPSPIVQSLIGPALARYPVYFDSLASTVDLSNAHAAMQGHPQIEAQVAVADSILFTKADLVDQSAQDLLTARVKALNPRAARFFVPQGVVSSTALFGRRLLDPSARARDLREALGSSASGVPPSSTNGHAHGSPLQSFVVERSEPMSYGTLHQFLRALQGYKGQDLLRVKGLVQIQGKEKRPMVIHGVQSVMHPPHQLPAWPKGMNSTHLVFITKNISEEDIQNLLSGIEGRPFRPPTS